jgi:hypothetical protein
MMTPREMIFAVAAITVEIRIVLHTTMLDGRAQHILAHNVPRRRNHLR